MRKAGIMLILILVIAISASAHSGKTDANGGHWDSETGEYHYHHGYPAHDHVDMDGDGILDCPYEFDDKTGQSSGNSSGSSSENKPNTVPTTAPSVPKASSTEPSSASSSESYNLGFKEGYAEAREKYENASGEQGYHTENKTAGIIFTAAIFVISGSVLSGVCVSHARNKEIEEIKRISEDDLRKQTERNHALSKEVASLDRERNLLSSKVRNLNTMLAESREGQELIRLENDEREDKISELEQRIEMVLQDDAVLQSILDERTKELEDIKSGLRKPHLEEIESLQSQLAEKEKLEESMQRLKSDLERQQSMGPTERFMFLHDPLHTQSIEIPDGVHILENVVVAKGEITRLRPFGDYTVYISESGRKYHAKQGCGMAYKPVHVFDVIRKRAPCMNCVPSNRFPEYEPYWYTRLKMLAKGETMAGSRDTPKQDEPRNTKK